MKVDKLSHYLPYGLQMVRKSGFMVILNPVSSFREFREAKRYKDSEAMLEMLDYSTQDLAKNQEHIARFGSMQDFKKETINWFIPYFKHPYGGLFTIFRFADYFRTKKSIENRFIVCGNALASATEIRKEISLIFPNLSLEKIVVLGKGKRDLANLPQADICIATSWPTAYHVLKFSKTSGKFYFIQDYEPLFYPAGVDYALAEATYRFGFYGIINTSGLYCKYTQEYGGIAEFFNPSVDDMIFYPSDRKPTKPSAENPFTIFFYARPGTPRNAFDLGVTALKKIKKTYHDRVRVYAAGSSWNPRTYDLEGDIINLGVLPYEETASLYRKCDLGIVFMFTRHPSYLPFELMACGCPVLTNHNPATTWFLRDGVNCILTEPTVSCICKKIEMLMDNPSLRNRMISNGLNSIGQSNWEKEIEKIYKFICNPRQVDRGNRF